MKDLLCFLLNFSRKRTKGWGQEREIDKEGKKCGESDERE